MRGALWSSYVRTVAGEASQSDIAEAVGVSQGTVSRWLTGTTVPSSGGDVAAFCHTYGRSPIEGFIAAGMLTEEEAGRALTVRQRRFLEGVRSEARSVEQIAEAAERRKGRKSSRAPQRHQSGAGA